MNEYLNHDKMTCGMYEDGVNVNLTAKTKLLN